MATFDVLARAIERCTAAGRFAPADAAELAFQFWAIGHGAVTRQLTGLYSPDEARRFAAVGLHSLFVGWGDDPQAARRSLMDAGRRRTPAPVPSRAPANYTQRST